MALTKASDILGLRKKIEEFAVPIKSLSASKVSVDLPGFSATNAAEAFEELDLDISTLSASVLTIGEKLENISTYSTEEKAIGKWIDGSDLYEKTIVVTSGITGDTTIPHGITNLDNVISINGFMNMTSSGGQVLNCPALTSSAAQFSPQYATCIKDINDTNFTFSIGASRLSQGVKNVIVTIKYTKTAPVTTKKTTKKRG